MRQNRSIPDRLIFNYRFNLLTATAGLLSASERRMADNVRRTVSLFPGVSPLDVLFYDDKRCRAALLEYSAELLSHLRFNNASTSQMRVCTSGSEKRGQLVGLQRTSR